MKRLIELLKISPKADTASVRRYKAALQKHDIVIPSAQSKSIEITSNGTTEVVPDSGFAYLSKVNIKTNVPQNGEGGGSDEQVIKYYKIDTNYNGVNYADEWKELLVPFVKRTESISNYDASIRTCLYSGSVTSNYGNTFNGIVTGDGEDLVPEYVSDAWWTISDPYSGLFVNTLTSFLQDKTIDGIPNLLDCITEVSQKEFYSLKSDSSSDSAEKKEI